MDAWGLSHIPTVMLPGGRASWKVRIHFTTNKVKNDARAETQHPQQFPARTSLWGCSRFPPDAGKTPFPAFGDGGELVGGSGRGRLWRGALGLPVLFPSAARAEFESSGCRELDQ